MQAQWAGARLTELMLIRADCTRPPSGRFHRRLELLRPRQCRFMTKVPLLLGSEKFGKPWVRMHEAILVSAGELRSRRRRLHSPVG